MLCGKGLGEGHVGQLERNGTVCWAQTPEPVGSRQRTWSAPHGLAVPSEVTRRFRAESHCHCKSPGNIPRFFWNKQNSSLFNILINIILIYPSLNNNKQLFSFNKGHSAHYK